ncbi:MAG: hypothetical protein L0213_09990, partial [Candidatus Dadabacteria bacterium]|nr:hypothetical protein [Candidatus Dadabacteria bacterium]
MIDNFDDFDSDIPVNYRGFDLSDIDYNELPALMEKIDLIHEDMDRIKNLSNKLIGIYEFSESIKGDLTAKRVPVYEQFIDEGIKEYGEDRGRELIELLLGGPQESPKQQIAKAKALLISYERLFEDEESEPIHPSQFEES